MKYIFEQIIPAQHSVPVDDISYTKGLIRLLIMFPNMSLGELSKKIERPLDWVIEMLRINILKRP